MACLTSISSITFPAPLVFSFYFILWTEGLFLLHVENLHIMTTASNFLLPCYFWFGSSIGCLVKPLLILHLVLSVHYFVVLDLQVVRSIAPLLSETLKPKLLTLLPCIFKCVRHSHVAVRLAASRCITSMAKSMTTDVMGAVIETAIPMLGDMTSVHARQGAGMLISLLVQGLGVDLVPYATLLVVPLLRCMSDVDHSVRQSVTRSFAALVPLLPLARGLPPPVGLSEGLSRNAEDAKFLEQLLDNSHIDDYKLCTELKVTLRR